MFNKILKSIFCGFLLSLLLVNCNNLSQEILSTKDKSLKTVMQSETFCDSFLVAVEQFDRLNKLISEKDTLITIIVPSNESFRTYLLKNSKLKVDDIARDTLERIVKHCFLLGRVQLNTIANNSYLKTFQSGHYEEGLLIRVANSVRSLYHSNDSIPAKLIISDVVCNNGNLNRSDKVVLPKVVQSTKTLMETLKLNNLDSLIKLISLVPRLTNLVNSDSSFTLFAPNNESFSEYLKGTSLNSMTSSELKKLAEYHFVYNQLYENQLYKNLSLVTLSNSATSKTLVIRRSGSIITFLSSANIISLGGIISPDIKSDKAIIHLISTVLNPK